MRKKQIIYTAIILHTLLMVNTACTQKKVTVVDTSQSKRFRFAFFEADLHNQGQVEVVAVIENTKRSKLLYVAPEILRKRDVNTVAWGEDDRLWICSGDTGLWYCQKDKFDKWMLYPYKKGESPNPPNVPGIDDSL